MSGRQGMYDHHISIFSPEGRLYQVEYALQAAKTVGGETAVGVQGKDSVAVVISKKVPDKSMDKDFVTRLYQINKKIGAFVVFFSRDKHTHTVQEAHSTFGHKLHIDGGRHFVSIWLLRSVHIRSSHKDFFPSVCSPCFSRAVLTIVDYTCSGILNDLSYKIIVQHSARTKRHLIHDNERVQHLLW